MKLLFKILTTVFLLFIQSVYAEQFKIVVPFAVGNLGDATVRAVSASIERNTDHTVTVVNRPGAETIVAANEFARNPSMYDVILLSGSQVIWNPVLKPDLVQYTDADFNYLIRIGTAYAFWVTSTSTDLKTPKDLTKKLPPSVGGFASAYNVNLSVLTNKYPQDSSIVQYKGTDSAVIDLINGSLKLALVTPSRVLIDQVRAGRLRIIGTTGPDDLMLEGIRIVSVSKKLGLPSISGVQGFATHSNTDPIRTEKIKNLLWQGLMDPQTQQILASYYIKPNHSNDRNNILEFYQDQRRIAQKYTGQQ
jgi:tripartite-type tricarboxylate transporter receptor subunit TctC